ncbi:MAG TPA: trimethylamine methyltransferase [Peptococcaceae bacterium]|jgi:trimethylamine--corrinoid protein Co-methyltransferase|nr:trimethylamine methyltransferase family protein [Syntrophaceticus sp.]HBI26179.1 trimethylamine methyltransferase [Peptococcaceae bacterium]
MNYASSHGEGIAYQTLTRDQVHDIHSASCRILEEVGVIVHHEEAAELLKKWGAHVDANNRTHIPEALVKRALQTAPSRITLYNRLGDPAIWLEKSNVHFGAGSDTLVYLDPFTGERRPWTTADVVSAIRVVDALPQLDFVMSMGLLSDVDKRMINRTQYALMIKNSVKPQVVIAEDASTVEDIFEMAAAAVGGKEILRNRPHFVLYLEPTSPLQLPFESVDKLLFAADNKIPVNFACGAVEGASTPVTVAGTVAQANAEALCGLVVHQLRNPGAPFLYGYGGSPLDMRTMGAIYAMPEVLLLQGAVCDMGRFYSLPTWGYAGCSSSKSFDEQAVVEATMFTLMGALQGCNLMHDTFYIESGRTGSLNLLVLMDEVISRARFLLKGINTTPEYLAVDAVKRVGPGGSYLGDPHTSQHFREKWQPSLSDFSNFNSWEAAGSEQMGTRIQEKLRQIMDEYEPAPLGAEVEEKIDAVLSRAQEKLVD